MLTGSPGFLRAAIREGSRGRARRSPRLISTSSSAISAARRYAAATRCARRADADALRMSSSAQRRLIAVGRVACKLVASAASSAASLGSSRAWRARPHRRRSRRSAARRAPTCRGSRSPTSSTSAQRRDAELVRQPALVDDVDARPSSLSQMRAVVAIADFHIRLLGSTIAARAAMLPPSTVVTSAVVRSASA